ncbi:MAG: hypothetical protein LBC13_02400 [Clostridiales bacterium]|jgi:hypothetical protein|nr:hypothetical protein [Clostridiales bacterium]
MQFLNDIYAKLTELTAKIENFEVGGFFIGLVIAIAAIFLIIALCSIGNKATKLKSASRRISKYIANSPDGIIDDENVEDFEIACINKSPKTVKLQWAAFMEQRFGYPSEFVSEKACYKRPKVLYAREFGVSLFNAVLVVLIGAYFILGIASEKGTLEEVLTNSIYAVIAGAVLSFVLVLIGRLNVNACLKAFYKMQDDLDTAVMLQNLKAVEPSNEELSTASKEIEEVIGGAVAKYPKSETEEEYRRGITINNNIYIDRNNNVATEEVKPEPAPVRDTAASDYVDGLYDDDEAEVLADEVVITDTADYIEGVYDDDDVATLEDEDNSNFTVAESDKETVADSAEIKEDVSASDEIEEVSELDSASVVTVSELTPAPVVKASEPVPAPVVEKEKPPKFAKLPPFMDYLLTTHTKRSTYIAITRVLIGAYFSAADPRDKVILKNCLYTMLKILTRPEFMNPSSNT